MPVRPVVMHPDPGLRQVAHRADPTDPALPALIADMFDTMYDAYGRGLAAPQIGEATRVFVMDATWKAGDRTPMAFVNPVIVDDSDERATLTEACLSIADTDVAVTRPARVEVSWTDPQGTPQRRWFDGFEAACVQHEIDHLDGILILDRAT